MNRCLAIRNALGLRQRELGDQLGISQAHVSRIEAGEPFSKAIGMLLDRIASENGLPHLVHDVFSSAQAPSLAAAPEASAASPSGEAA